MNGCWLIRRRGEDVARAEEGYADPVAGDRVTAATRFQIASISKGFTAAAVMRLVDSKSLTLATSIDRWFANSPPVWAEINIHHLLTHTSGLGHWDDYDIDPADSMDAGSEIDLFKTRQLFAPGTAWYYSSPGYVLLAWIVERASGKSYQDFLTTEVLAPTGLTNSFVGNANDRTNVACGLIQGKPATSFELDVVSIGAGDVWCTADDLARWNEQITQGSLLSAAARDPMFAPSAQVPDTDRSYGYGWVIGDFAGHSTFFHQGGNRGFRAISVWLPDEQLSLVVLSNDQETNVDAVAERLLREFAPSGRTETR